jgi:hypothetical protein
LDTVSHFLSVPHSCHQIRSRQQRCHQHLSSDHITVLTRVTSPALHQYKRSTTADKSNTALVTRIFALSLSDTYFQIQKKKLITATKPTPQAS